MRYAVLSKSAALYLECVHHRLNWAEKGVDQLFVRLYRLLMSAPTIDVPTLPENNCDMEDIETKHHEDVAKWKSTKWGQHFEELRVAIEEELKSSEEVVEHR